MISLFREAGRGCGLVGLFCFAADLNPGEFTGVSLETVFSLASQLRLRIS